MLQFIWKWSYFHYPTSSGLQTLHGVFEQCYASKRLGNFPHAVDVSTGQRSETRLEGGEGVDKNQLHLMSWPSQSPYLSPIEHLWEHLARSKGGLTAINEAEKIEQLRPKWEEIRPGVINKLLQSMPGRYETVIKAKGYAIRY